MCDHPADCAGCKSHQYMKDHQLLTTDGGLIWLSEAIKSGQIRMVSTIRDLRDPEDAEVGE